MTVEEIAQIVLQALEDQNITYMLVGSLASNLHGLPRATHDADIVIDCDKDSMEKFMDSLKEDFYADKLMALDALKTKFMFNVIHFREGIKVDIIIKKARAFDNEQFKRRLLMPFRGTERWISSPEDTILAKLLWQKDSGSERQFQDAVDVARVQRENLDRPYLQKWATELRVQDLLLKIFDHIDNPT